MSALKCMMIAQKWTFLKTIFWKFCFLGVLISVGSSVCMTVILDCCIVTRQHCSQL